MVVRRLCAIVWALSCCCWSRQAAAQEAPTRPVAEAVTVVPGDDECLTQARIAERLARLLDSPVIDAGIEVEVHLDRDGETVRFLMGRSGQAEAERRFDLLPRECAARLDAVSLAIALAIDHTVIDRMVAESEEQPPEISSEVPAEPPATAEAPPPEHDAVPSETPEPPLPVEAPSPETPGREERPPSGATLGPRPASDEPDRAAPASTASRLGISAFAGGFAALALLPEPVLGLRFGGGLRFGPVWEVRLGGFATSESETRLGLGKAAMRLFSGELSGCAGGRVSRLRLDACAGLGAGSLVAAGREFPEGLKTRSPWLGAMLGASGAFPADSPVALRLRVEGQAPILGTVVRVEDSRGGVVDEQALPPAGALVGIELVAGVP